MNFSGTNLDQGQAYNRRLVLEAIRVHGALSRAELTRLTGLVPQTISNIATTFIDAGLLISERRQATGRGQPPVDLRLNPQGGYAFGISIDNQRLFAVLVDIAGNRLGQLEDRLESTSPDFVLPRIESAILKLRTQHQVLADRILGTGFAMSGLTTHGDFVGLAPDRYTAQWSTLNLEDELMQRLAMPIFTENDARAAAIGEAFYGNGRNYRNFVYIYFGVGIGGSMIASGQPFRGGQGRAGEFGHMIVEPGGLLCPCGNRGCLEQYASIESAIAALEASDSGESTDDRLIQALEDKDPGLLRWIETASRHLRTAITNLENVLDPEIILLGGIIPKPLLDAIIAGLDPMPRTVSSRREDDESRVIASNLGHVIPAMGAASLALFEATSADLSLLFKKNT